MLIKKMSASFGKLENAELTLSPGLNIIEAPNESGKSTWCAFICAMFYGFDPSERDSKTSIASKNRYKPWNGSAMSGRIELVHNGVPITIERSGSGRTPFTKFKAYHSDTGEKIEWLTADGCGLTLFGVERQVFERSAFVHQSGITISRSDDLERRLTALVTTGEDGLSYSECEARLREWLRRRRHNKSGRLPSIEAERDELRRRERAFLELDEMKQGLVSRMDALEERRSRLELELLAIAESERRDQRRRLAEAAAEMDQRLAESAACEQALKSVGPIDSEKLSTASAGLATLERLERELMIMRMDDGADEELEETLECFEGMSPDEAWSRASADMERCNELFARSRAGMNAGIGVALLLLVLGLIAAAGFLLPQAFVYCIIGGALVLGAYMFLLMRSRRQANEAGEEAMEILRAYDAHSSSGILEAASLYREKCAVTERRESRLREQQVLVDEKRAELDAKKAALLEYVRSFIPETADLAHAKDEIQRIRKALSDRDAAAERLTSAQKLYESLFLSAGEATTEVPAELPEPSMSREAARAELSRVEREITTLSSSYSMTLGEMRGLGDLNGINARMDSLNETYSLVELEYSAIDMALEAMAKANSELRTRLSPQLNARAAEIMSLFTGNRYDRVMMERDMSVLVGETNQTLSRKATALSSGTIDQLYLAVRLALCELLLPEKAAVPLILDDAFGRFDDERLGMALRWVKKEAEKRQILIFTCQGREKAFFAGK